MINYLKKIKISIIAFLLSFQSVFADEIMVLEKPKGSFGSLDDMMKVIIDGILKVSIPVLVLAGIYVGFLFVKAQGNQEDLKKAKTAFMWFLVGAGIILGANTIYSVIFDTAKSLQI